MSLVRALAEDGSLPRKAESTIGIGLSATCLVTLIGAPADTPRAISAGISLVAVAVFTLARFRPRAAHVSPWIALVLIYVWVGVSMFAFGPTFAFMSWVPSMLVLFFLAVSVLRLEVWRPIATALIASVLQVGLYLVAMHLELPDYSVPGVERDAIHAMRGFVLNWHTIAMGVLWQIGAGVAFAVAVVGLRGALRKAERVVRQNDLFGKYRLGAPIASGGMATVVHASYCPDGGFERPVAIKRIHPHLAAQEIVVERFRREAEIGARLAHPNIVSVLDFGRVEDTWFIAMEHVDGTDLRRLLLSLRRRKNRMPAHLAGLIAHAVLQGLAFAHGGARDKDGRLLHVVHRDLSPANVLIASTGDVKIADFGIACALREAEAHHTRHLAGSVCYLAPEQARRGGLDQRADLFAVGVLLWEMLTGRQLWRRDEEAMTLLAILHEEAPLVQWLGVSSCWDAVLSRALAKDPAARFDNAKEMADAIERVVVAEHGSLPHPDELAAFLAAHFAASDLASVPTVAMTQDDESEAATEDYAAATAVMSTAMTLPRVA
jgi:serine/threonine-protein kinase